MDSLFIFKKNKEDLKVPLLADGSNARFFKTNTGCCCWPRKKTFTIASIVSAAMALFSYLGESGLWGKITTAAAGLASSACLIFSIASFFCCLEGCCDPEAAKVSRASR